MQSDFFDHVIQPPLRAPMADRDDTFPVRQRHWCCNDWQTMDNVISKKSYLNPRMVYDLGGNIILVQRYYRCTYQGFDRQCRYLSGSAAIAECLPGAIQTFFPSKNTTNPAALWIFSILLKLLFWKVIAF